MYCAELSSGEGDGEASPRANKITLKEAFQKAAEYATGREGPIKYRNWCINKNIKRGNYSIRPWRLSFNFTR